MIKNYRVDIFLIWGHGIKYLFEILKILEKEFEIIRIERKKIKNIKKFVKFVYSFDYAPYWHLIGKTKYLLKTPKEVAFIIVKNYYLGKDDYVGQGEFRHLENLKIKEIKELIRDKFNPYENNKRSHNHIVHATDNESQSDYLLKYLGFKNGILDVIKKNMFDLPHYINLEDFEIIKIPLDKLYANILKGSLYKYQIILTPLKQTPHYKALSSGDFKIYENYINKFLGGPLKEYYSVEKFKKLSKNFVYLKAPFENNYIVVVKKDDKYIIADGIHRACNLANEKEIIVCLNK